MVIARFVYSQTAMSFGNLRKARQGKGIREDRARNSDTPSDYHRRNFQRASLSLLLNVGYSGPTINIIITTAVCYSQASHIFACSRIRCLGIDRQIGKALLRNRAPKRTFVRDLLFIKSFCTLVDRLLSMHEE